MYDSVQYVGVELVTSKTQGLSNDRKDIASRLEIISDMIDKVQQSGSINPNKKCLKIMAFPEFLFRGSIGAYDMEKTLKIVENLRKMVNKPRFKDWLFVFGTIVGYSKNEKYEEMPYDVYNFSFIQEGNKGEENSYVVLKKRMSLIDFAPGYKKNRITVDNSYYLRPLKEKNIRGEQQILNYDGNAIFNVGGLKIGLEICLDTLQNRINPLDKYNKKLDVHMVISCGIDMYDLKNYGKLQRDGVFLLCDGSEGDVRIGVSKKCGEPSKTVISYEPKDSETFRKMFTLDFADIDVYEPVKVLEKTKEIENIKVQKNELYI